jgi:hypothetical protein
MKCEICGKELTGNKTRFCSKECRLMYWEYSENPKPKHNRFEEIKKCKEIAEKLMELTGLTFYNRSKVNQKIKSVYVYYCKSKGYSYKVMGKAIKQDHTTLMRRMEKVTEDDKIMANSLDKHFIKEVTNYDRTGFRYS